MEKYIVGLYHQIPTHPEDEGYFYANAQIDLTDPRFIETLEVIPVEGFPKEESTDYLKGDIVNVYNMPSSHTGYWQIV